MGTKKPRILLACAPEPYTRLFAILSGRELTFVSTLTDAHAALKADHFDMIMIGVHFDESRMFDLLRYVRADAKYDRVPVVCFRGITVPNAKGKVVLEAVEVACKAMGANAFFDLMGFADDTVGNAAVRKIIDGFLESEQNGR
ncbi:MAG: hypothetical protein HY695_01305 [Deltaproteobacteria bacterium]|nr:hypothetical protein [Deltaproteobacteria bacterium]